MYIHAYHNDYTPTDESVCADFTFLYPFLYQLVNPSIPEIIDGRAYSQYDVINIGHWDLSTGGDNVIYGYVCAYGGFDPCLFAERFDTPFPQTEEDHICFVTVSRTLSQAID
jgi:hypothetical protein